MTTSVRCVGCELLAFEQEQVPEGADGYGVRIGLVPRPVWEEHQRVEAARERS
ncbi:hypothetical protein ACN20G_33405 (plasmid) [Streptomyces sp. BI20]|uniref:hypothetical protein n=1 Tax=Streptomyces sp. BI20 TaxID=3403460 RepID=UPI003C710A21